MLVTLFILGHVAILLGYLMTLVAPVAREVWDDAHGDAEVSNRFLDLFFRTFLMFVSVLYASFAFDKPWQASAPLSVAFFLATFDYVVAYYLIRNKVVVGHWFSYLSLKKWTDEVQALIPAWARFILKLAALACAIMWFVVS